MTSDHPNPLDLRAQPHLEPDAQAHPQAHPDACFDASWLALRRAADSAARAPELEARAADWLRQRRTVAAPGQPLRLIDLGSGSGANPRHLAPRLPGPQQWTLIDHDGGLLARAQAACAGLRDAEGGSVGVVTRCLDLGRIDAHTIAGADLVCASALLDLVDAAWLEQLADACTAAGSALLVTLSVDGNWRFVPDAAMAKLMAAPSPARAAAVQAANDAAHAVANDATATAADDDFVRTAFNAHQRRDKGLGARWTWKPRFSRQVARAGAASGPSAAPSPLSRRWWALKAVRTKSSSAAGSMVSSATASMTSSEAASMA